MPNPFLRRGLMAGLLAAPVVAATPPAAAQTRSADQLTIGYAAVVTTLDPHYHNLGPNNAMGNHIFDRLVERDARAKPQPGLAESYRPLSDIVWEFRLRRGVTWHDGKPFTADDVVFTFERAPNVP
ncbi:ABC transporter substrate-binding protein, partial [Siccirubricoccus sp. KC 17139]